MTGGLPDLDPRAVRLSKLSVFAGLPERDVALLDRLLHVVRWRSGPPPGALMLQGHLFVVREGQVALFERAHSGHLVMLAVLQTGAVYTSLGDAPSPYVDALCPSAVSPVPERLIEQLISRYPRLGLNLAQTLSERVAEMREVAGVLAEQRVEDRLRARLFEVAERSGTTSTDGVRIPFELTHAQWALLVGGSRESVTLAFGKLRANREVLMDGRKIILTWPAMGERRPGGDLPTAPASPASSPGVSTEAAIDGCAGARGT